MNLYEWPWRLLWQIPLLACSICFWFYVAIVLMAAAAGIMRPPPEPEACVEAEGSGGR